MDVVGRFLANPASRKILFWDVLEYTSKNIPRREELVRAVLECAEIQKNDLRESIIDREQIQKIVLADPAVATYVLNDVATVPQLFMYSVLRNDTKLALLIRSMLTTEKRAVFRVLDQVKRHRNRTMSAHANPCEDMHVTLYVKVNPLKTSSFTLPAERIARDPCIDKVEGPRYSLPVTVHVKTRDATSILGMQIITQPIGTSTYAADIINPMPSLHVYNGNNGYKRNIAVLHDAHGTIFAMARFSFENYPAMTLDFLTSNKMCRGAGNVVLRVLEHWARASKATRLELHSVQDAVPFYFKAGYSSDLIKKYKPELGFENRSGVVHADCANSSKEYVKVVYPVVKVYGHMFYKNTRYT